MILIRLKQFLCFHIPTSVFTTKTGIFLLAILRAFRIFGCIATSVIIAFAPESWIWRDISSANKKSGGSMNQRNYCSLKVRKHKKKLIYVLSLWNHCFKKQTSVRKNHKELLCFLCTYLHTHFGTLYTCVVQKI